jgi:hypothetical protein
MTTRISLIGQFGRTCAYFHNQHTHMRRFVNAFHVKFGGQFPIGARWTMDTYIGLGLRGLRVRYLSPAPNEMPFEHLFGIRTSRPGIYRPHGSLSVGFHFGYRLGETERQSKE